MLTKVYQVKYTIASFWNFGISSALILWRQCKKRTSFKTLISKKATIWRLKESQSNKKRLQKTMTSSYEMEQKTFIEASCVYHINTGGKVLCSCYFWRFVSFFFCYSVKKIRSALLPVPVSFVFLKKRRPNKYSLWEVNLISYMKIFSLICQSVTLDWNYNSLKQWLCFPLFL